MSTTGGAPSGPHIVDRADHHKHMEFIQAVVSRLANNSFLMKGWALTLSSAILGFAVTQRSYLLALTAVIPAGAFWLLDTYYLRQERAFRAMYADVAAKQITNFVIDSRRYASRQRWLSAGFSVSLWVFYVSIIGVSAIVALVIGIAPIGDKETIPADVRITVEPQSSTPVQSSPTRPGPPAGPTN